MTMTMDEYLKKLQRSLDNVLEENKTQQETISTQQEKLDHTDELMRLLAPSMSLLDGSRETLTEKMGKLLRAYERAGGTKHLKEEEDNGLGTS